MRTTLTSVQLAILETKQLEFAKALQRQDELHRAAQQILEIGEFDGHADDHLADFLNGFCTGAELLERISVVAAPAPVFDPAAVHIYGRDIPVVRGTE